ncbi:MAG: GAF domain-containing protein [Candidatus Rokubacteria bacterium]|nr:GAF domain-containing protein [Candidatus Rokubacteria bacterium]
MPPVHAGQQDERLRFAALAADVGVALTRSDTVRDVLQLAAEALVRHLDVAFARIWTLPPNGDVLHLEASAGLYTNLDGAYARVPVGEQKIGWVAANRRPYLTNDVRDDSQIDAAWARREGMVAFAGAPLIVEDRLAGVVAMFARRRLPESTLDLLRPIAVQLALWIERQRAEAALRYHVAKARSMVDVGRAITSSLDLQSVLDLIVERACALLGTPRSSLAIAESDPRGPVIRFVAHRGLSAAFRDRMRPLHWRDGTTARAILERRPCWSADLLNDPSIELTASTRGAVEAEGYRAVLSAPLVVGDRVLGALVVYRDEPSPFSPDEVEVLEVFAAQAAVALENARLYREQATRATRLSTLAALNQVVSSSLDTNRVLERVGEAAADLLGAPFVALWTADESTGQLERRAVATAGGVERPVLMTSRFGTGLIGTVASTRRTLNVPDIFVDGVVSTPEWFRAQGLSSYLGVPILFQGSLLGVLSMFGRTPFEFSRDDDELLQSFVGHAAVALHNARLYQRAEARAEKLRALSTLTRLIISAADARVVCDEVARAATTLLDAAFSRVWVTDPSRGELVAQGSFGIDATTESRLTTRRTMPYGTGVVTGVLATKQPEFILDVQDDARLQNRRLATELGIRAYAGIPMLAGERVVGVLTVLFTRRREFIDEDKELMQLLADQAAIAIDKARLFADAERRRQEAEVVADLARDINASLDLDTVLRRVAEGARRLCGADLARIALRAPGETTAVFRYFPGARFGWEGVRVEAGRGSGGWVLATERPFRTEDYRADPRITKDYIALADEEGTVAEMVVPIRGQQRVEGLLYVTNRSPRPFTDRDEAVLLRLAEYARTAIDNARLYEALRDAKERVERSQTQLVQTERLRALGEMAAGVAHDFNNMLAVILGRAELLLARATDAYFRHGLDAIRKAAQDGADTVRRIQEFTRTRTTRPFGVVDLSELVREVIELTRPRWEDEAQSRGVRYEVRMDGTAGPVAGRPEELREVFTNLLTNALEAMPAGGSCRFRLGVRDDCAIVSVSDSGSGMSDVTRRRVFEPFFTTKGPRGTGLGLAVSWGIVTRHAGTIEVESELGRGSTFHVALPLVTDAARVDDSAPVTLPARRAHILVIDDEPEVRDVLVDLLREAGHTVVHATDGTDGLRHAETQAFDIVLTDVSMPGLSGWDVAEAVRRRHPGVPVGLVTGWGDQLDTERLARHRVSFVIAKPFRADDVLNEVALALRAR